MEKEKDNVNIKKCSELERMKYRPYMLKKYYSFDGIDNTLLSYETEFYKGMEALFDDNILDKWKKERENISDGTDTMKVMNKLWELMETEPGGNVSWVRSNGYRPRNLYDNILEFADENLAQKNAEIKILRKYGNVGLKITNEVLPGFVLLYLGLRDDWWLEKNSHKILDAHKKDVKINHWDLAFIEAYWNHFWRMNLTFLTWLEEIDRIFINLEEYQKLEKLGSRTAILRNEKNKIPDRLEQMEMLMAVINKQRELLESVVNFYDKGNNFKIPFMNDLKGYAKNKDIANLKTNLKVEFCYYCLNDFSKSVLSKQVECYWEAKFKLLNMKIDFIFNELKRLYPLNYEEIKNTKVSKADVELREKIDVHIHEMFSLLRNESDEK